MESLSEITNNLINYLKNLSDDEWKLKVNDRWTVFDVFAHLVAWVDEVVKVLPECWKKQISPWFMDNDDDYAEFNNRRIQDYRKLNSNQLISEYIRLNRKLDDIIGDIGIDQIRKSNDFGWVLDESDENHELYHFNQIKKVVEKQRSSK